MGSANDRQLGSFGMKAKLLLLLNTAMTAQLLVSGCASKTSEPARAAVSKSDSPASPSTPAAPGTQQLIETAATKPSLPFDGEGWQPLFDGKTLTGWRPTLFAGRGEVEIENGLLIFNMGDPFTGVNYTNDVPNQNYEIALDAMRVNGSDFFCGLTVPVGTNNCSLIVGGWGGSLVGISSFDGMDASENETTRTMNFEQGRWYRIRMRVVPGKIQAWIDQDRVADVDTTDRKISVRPGDIEMSKPFGLACWQTTAALRNIKIRHVETPAPKEKR